MIHENLTEVMFELRPEGREEPITQSSGKGHSRQREQLVQRPLGRPQRDGTIGGEPQWGLREAGETQDGEEAGNLGMDNSGKLAGVGLSGAWRLNCQVPGKLTPLSGPVSAAQDPGSLHGEPAVSWTSKADQETMVIMRAVGTSQQHSGGLQ